MVLNMKKSILSFVLILSGLALLAGCTKAEKRGKSVYLDTAADIACYAVVDRQDPGRIMIVDKVYVNNYSDDRRPSEIDLIMETLSGHYLFAESSKALGITKDSFPEPDQEAAENCSRVASHIAEHSRLAVYALGKKPSAVDEISISNSVYSVFVSSRDAGDVIGMMNQWVSFDSEGDWLFLGTDMYTDMIDLWAQKQKDTLKKDQLYYIQY